MRFLTAEENDAYSNLALEEAIFQAQSGPTVRVWENVRSVIIGRGQLARLETDLEYCKKKEIPIARRFSAGGAVYNGPGNLNWSFFVPKSSGTPGLRYVDKVTSIFSTFAQFVVAALKDLGVDAHFTPPNAINDSKGKVSGMASYLSRDALLCHGTLLCSADLKEAEQLTTPAPRQSEKKYVRSNLSSMSNTGVSPASFREALRGVVSRETGFELVPDVPSSTERRIARQLSQKYHSKLWNLGDPFEQLVSW